MDRMENAVTDAKETTEKIREEIDNQLECEEDSEEGILKAVFHVLSNRALTKKESKMLTSLLDGLFTTIYDCLSNPYVHGRIADLDQLASTIDDDIRSVVSAYMDVWRFIYEHPGTLLQFKREYERTASSRRS